MKIRSLLLTVFSIFIANSIFSQTIHNGDIKPSITKEQILELGNEANSSKDVITLDFEGLGNEDGVANFYNGGSSNQGFSGLDYGIYFGGNTLSIIDEDAGGTGNFANEPSPSTIMFFLTGSAVMNVPNGFVNGFSFFYTSSEVGTIYVYDGLNATGNLLASVSFPALSLGNIGGDPNGYFDNWQPFGAAFQGIAKSVDFTGVQNQCGFDNVTFGNVNPPLNIPPVAQGLPAIQPIELVVGSTYNLSLSFHSPEPNQITNAVVNSFGLSDFNYTVTPGNICGISLSLLATLSNVGEHTVQFIATDNGTPNESTTVYVTFEIINPIPVIIEHPQSITATVGQSASFSVEATGAETLYYQWEKEGSNISGANLPVYSIQSVTEDDAGNYSCTVSNDYGTATSNNALLTVNSGVLESMQWGSLVIYASHFENTAGTEWKASGSVSINNLLQFSGDLEFNVDPLNLLANGNCKIFMTGIPYLATVDLYEGAFEFTLQGYLLNGLLNEANNLLKVAGLNAKIDKIEIIPSKIDGVRIEGKLVLPQILNNVEVEVNTLRITKSMGIQFEGSVLVEDLEVNGVFGIEKLFLTFNTIENNFHGEIEGLSAKVFKMDASYDIINGKLDAIGAGYYPPIPQIAVGSTGFRISNIDAGVSGLAYPPLILSAGIDLEPVIQGDFDLVALTDLNVVITWGESFSGSGNLTIFNQGVANVYLSISSGQIVFGGSADFAGILVGNLNTCIKQVNSGIDFQGMMYAALIIPNGQGFPFGLIKCIVNLPITLIEMENYIKNTKVAGNFTIAWLKLNYQLEYINHNFNFEMATGHQNWNQILFNKKYLNFDKSLNSKNRFEGLSLAINSENLNQSLILKRGVFEQSFNLASTTPNIIIRVSETGVMPVYSIKLPSGEVVNPSNIADFENIFYSENIENKEAYYTINNPGLGEYTLLIEDNGNTIYVDVFGALMPPTLHLKPLHRIDNNQIKIDWDCDDLDSDAKISLYFDNDNADANGTLIVTDISEDSDERSFVWDASNMPTGEYYVYGLIDDTIHKPGISYASNSILLINMDAPLPPTDLTSATNDTSIYLSWNSEQKGDNRFLLYYTENGEQVNFGSKNFNVGKVTEYNFINFLPGRKYQFALRTVSPEGFISDFSNVIEVEFESNILNNAPKILTSDITTKAFIDEEYNMPFNCFDADGDALNYHLESNANGIIVDDDGVVKWNPTNSDVGVYYVNFFVEDLIGAKDSISFQLVVLDYDKVYVDLSFNSPIYDCFCDFGVVTVKDIGFNGNPNVIDTVMVSVFSKSNPDGINLPASETQPNSNVFKGVFELTNKLEEANKLLVNVNDSLWALYDNELKKTVEKTFSYFELGEQQINEKLNWSAISSYILPDEPKLESLMSNETDKGNLTILIGKSGIFWPSQHINTIGNWNTYEGYKVKMSTADDVRISGKYVENKSVNLSQGINYLPILSGNDVLATDIFNQISGQLIFAFDLGGAIYWPGGGLYTLQTLEPGKAYLVSMSAAASVTFPETVKSGHLNSNKIQVVENSPWTVENTGVGHIISIYQSALADLKTGDIIAAFNSTGLCVGVTQFMGDAENLPLVVYLIHVWERLTPTLSVQLTDCLISILLDILVILNSLDRFSICNILRKLAKSVNVFVLNAANY